MIVLPRIVTAYIVNLCVMGHQRTMETHNPWQVTKIGFNYDNANHTMNIAMKNACNSLEDGIMCKKTRELAGYS